MLDISNNGSGPQQLSATVADVKLRELYALLAPFASDSVAAFDPASRSNRSAATRFRKALLNLAKSCRSERAYILRLSKGHAQVQQNVPFGDSLSPLPSLNSEFGGAPEFALLVTLIQDAKRDAHKVYALPPKSVNKSAATRLRIALLEIQKLCISYRGEILVNYSN